VAAGIWARVLIDSSFADFVYTESSPVVGVKNDFSFAFYRDTADFESRWGFAGLCKTIKEADNYTHSIVFVEFNIQLSAARDVHTWRTKFAQFEDQMKKDSGFLAYVDATYGMDAAVVKKTMLHTAVQLAVENVKCWPTPIGPAAAVAQYLNRAEYATLTHKQPAIPANSALLGELEKFETNACEWEPFHSDVLRTSLDKR
jgi:hypothetical protein